MVESTTPLEDLKSLVFQWTDPNDGRVTFSIQCAYYFPHSILKEKSKTSMLFKLMYYPVAGVLKYYLFVLREMYWRCIAISTCLKYASSKPSCVFIWVNQCNLTKHFSNSQTRFHLHISNSWCVSILCCVHAVWGIYSPQQELSPWTNRHDMGWDANWSLVLSRCHRRVSDTE